jgi:hypothetical protein
MWLVYNETSLVSLSFYWITYFLTRGAANADPTVLRISKPNPTSIRLKKNRWSGCPPPRIWWLEESLIVRVSLFDAVFELLRASGDDDGKGGRVQQQRRQYNRLVDTQIDFLTLERQSLSLFAITTVMIAIDRRRYEEILWNTVREKNCARKQPGAMF